MNFLSHYYVDRNKHTAPFVLGALLPDIAPDFTKTYNANIRYGEWNLEEPAASVHAGVLRHYEMDAIFHNSVVFKEACAYATGCMAEAGLDREKYRFWFLSHIVTEVLLDRQLILENPGLVDEYYAVLSSIDTNKMDAYLYFNVSKVEKNRILINFMKFMEVKFLQYLKTMDGAAESLVRTVHRAIGVSFTEVDREKLVIALHNIEGAMRYSSKKLLDHENSGN
jgi:hypothetical protein